jgi:hypothetical protein
MLHAKQKTKKKALCSMWRENIFSLEKEYTRETLKNKLIHPDEKKYKSKFVCYMFPHKALLHPTICVCRVQKLHTNYCLFFNNMLLQMLKHEDYYCDTKLIFRL